MEGDVEMAAAEGRAAAGLDDMKKRLKEMEDEAATLREIQVEIEQEMGSVQEYACSPKEVQQHFQSRGTVNGVTIRTNKFGQPKGYAYVEFLESEAVEQALHLNESELHGRQLKVSAKRTNVPGMKQFHQLRSNAYMGFQPKTPRMVLLMFILLTDMGRYPGLGCLFDIALAS